MSQNSSKASMNVGVPKEWNEKINSFFHDGPDLFWYCYNNGISRNAEFEKFCFSLDFSATLVLKKYSLKFLHASSPLLFVHREFTRLIIRKACRIWEQLFSSFLQMALITNYELHKPVCVVLLRRVLMLVLVLEFSICPHCTRRTVGSGSKYILTPPQ